MPKKLPHKPCADPVEERIITAILHLAGSGLGFHPRAIRKFAGLDEQCARLHCRLLVQAGKLAAYNYNDEVFYRAPALRQSALTFVNPNPNLTPSVSTPH